jgi:hypothetical protein
VDAAPGGQGVVQPVDQGLAIRLAADRVDVGQAHPARTLTAAHTLVGPEDVRLPRGMKQPCIDCDSPVAERGPVATRT